MQLEHQLSNIILPQDRTLHTQVARQDKWSDSLSIIPSWQNTSCPPGLVIDIMCRGRFSYKLQP
jgi:hypothetical protein